MVLMEKKRNPKWQRDELILALDLYFQLEPGQIHARNPLVIDLSDTLNKLPIHRDKEEYEKFRNPNGVGCIYRSTPYPNYILDLGIDSNSKEVFKFLIQ